MSDITLTEATLRLLAAAALSGVIGVEREIAQKNAGLRTHMLVGLGAGLFTLLGAEAFPGADPSRVAAQVVAGVGFLGAGAIFRHGLNVKGLTTAAGLWAVAAVGMAAGAGWYAVALAATTVAIVVLYVFWMVEWLLRGRTDQATAFMDVFVADSDAADRVATAAAALVRPGGRVAIRHIGPDGASVRVFVDPKRADATIVALRSIDAVIRVDRVDT
jgi:putative Mg2+ transporter-C (MgtC) family protein